jgi:hypothetical protein
MCSVNPLYYVTFTTSTLCASFILYGGFNTSDAVNTLSLISGFLVIFTGVYLLNLSRSDPDGHKLIHGGMDGIATDPLSGIQTRRSMQSRRSGDPHRISSAGYRQSQGEDRGLIHAYDEEEHNTGFGLADLASSDEEEEHTPRANGHAKKLYPNGSASASKRSFTEPTEREERSISRKSSPLPR